MIKMFFFIVKCFDVKAVDFGFVYKLFFNVYLEMNMICNDLFCVLGEIWFFNEKQIGEFVGMLEKKVCEMLVRLRKVGVVGVWY